MRAVGAGSWYEYKGRKYQLAPLTQLDFAEQKSYLRSIVPDPLEEARKATEGMAPEVQQHIMALAWEDRKLWGSLRSTEGREWASGNEGLSFFLWRSIMKNHPDISWDDCRTMINDMQRDHLKTVLDRIGLVSGLTLKNSERSASKKRKRRDPTPTAKKRMRQTKTKIGSSSSGRSVNGTPGRVPTS